MANSEVNFKIKVDGKELDLAKTSVNDFNKIYSETSAKLNNLPIGSKEWKDLSSELKNADKAFQQTKEIAGEAEGKFKSLRLQIRQTTVAFQEAEDKGDIKAMKKLKNDLDDLNDQLEVTTLKSMKFSDALATMPGIAGFVGQSIQGVDKAFKVLVANPILATVTAIVSAFMFMKEALSKTKEGQAALNKVSQAFSAVLGPLLAMINTVAVPIFEGLAEVITRVAGAFTWFAEKLGVSKKSIADATRDVDKVGQEAAEAEKERQKKALEDAKKAADDAKQKAEEAKKRKQNEINANEALQQSLDELAREQSRNTKITVDELKKEQKFKDDEFVREKKRIDDLMKLEVKGSIEFKSLQKERNDLEKAYVKDKRDRAAEITKTLEEQAAAEREYFKTVREIQIQAISDENQRSIAARQQKLKDDIDAYNKQADALKISIEERNSVIFDLQTTANRDILELNTANTLKQLDLLRNTLSLEEKMYTQQEETKVAVYQLAIKNRAIYLDDEGKMTVDAIMDQYELEHKTIADALKLEQKQLDDSFANKLISEEKYDERLNQILQERLGNEALYWQRRKALEELEIQSQEANADLTIRIARNTAEALSLIANGLAATLKLSADQIADLQIASAIFEAGIAIAQIIIDTQRAIIAFSASVAPLGPVGVGMAAAYATKSYIAAGIATATIIGSGISKITQANSQRKAGTAGAGAGGGGGEAYNGLGRNYEEGGYISGPRHAQGGVMINAEGGEAVMTRGAVTMFAPLLSQLNQMGGGTSFSKGAIGSAGFDNPKMTNTTVENPMVIKTYVVSNDMTSEQQKQARLKDLSTL